MTNPDGEGFLLDVHADFLDNLNTRMVVPLFPLTHAPKPAQHLNPCFEVTGKTLVMMTQFMATVPARILRHPVGSLKSRRDEIVAAVDFLMQGF